MRWRSRGAAALVLVAVLAGSGCDTSAPEHLQRARDRIFEKKPQEALKEYRLALELVERDSSAEGAVLRARVLKGAADVYYLELRDFRRAAEVYQELIRVCPEAPETLQARIQLAEILHTHFRDLRGAISSLIGAIDRNAPESAELAYRVAKLYFELGDYQQSTLEARKLQSRFETSPLVDDALLLEAQALALMEGRAPESIRALEALARRFPDSALAPIALYEMGKVRAETGEREEAIALWVKALARHPDPSQVQSAIAHLRKQIADRTPLAVGNEEQAFDRTPPAPIRPHRTSVEAVGGTAEEAS
ncbi:MAG TPA: tetratricopeptide repeat protein, partial [Myxococcaceae bacterium]|nr:tetratricopeptide repeat protein [Myxococcaceae bacterium]